jgi:uncharacterized protein
MMPLRLIRTVLLIALTKPARLYVSDAILAEYAAVLARPELKYEKGCGSRSSSSSKTALTARP